MKHTVPRVSAPFPLVTATLAMAGLAAALACSQKVEPQPGKPAGPGAPTVAVPAMPSDEELGALLQRTLDHPRLAPYWHADQPGRRPLRLVKNALAPLMKGLKLHGEAAQVMERAALEKDKLPWFEIRDLRPSNERVSLRFAYPVEGVVGELAFKKQDGAWVEEKFDLVER